MWRARIVRELEMARLEAELEAALALPDALRPLGEDHSEEDAARAEWERQAEAYYALYHSDDEDCPPEFPDELRRLSGS